MSGTASQLGPWAQARLPAAWRGCSFKVRESQIKRGRRQAVHEYPFRDTVWVEDLGTATRITALRGYLAGDDVDDQLRAMIAAAETPGEGTLIHPALGEITASLLEFTADDSADRGRVWTLEFVFVAGAARSYPTLVASTQSGVTAAVAGMPAAISGAYASVVASPLGQAVGSVRSAIASGLSVVRGVQSTIGGYVAQANSLVGSVQSVARSTIGLTGNLGRFSLGARLSTIPGLTSATSAIAQANAAASSVTRLGSTVSRLASLL